MGNLFALYVQNNVLTGHSGPERSCTKGPQAGYLDPQKHSQPAQ